MTVKCVAGCGASIPESGADGGIPVTCGRTECNDAVYALARKPTVSESGWRAWNSHECGWLGVACSEFGHWEIYDANGLAWHHLKVVAANFKTGQIISLKINDDRRQTVTREHNIAAPPLRIERVE